MTPAERLIAAADLLDKRAGEATGGPWRHHDTHLDLGGHTATVLSGEGNATELRAWLPTLSSEPWDTRRNVWADAAYIATMHPEVGKAQAAMLGVLGSVDYPEVRMGVSVHTQKVFDAALALADLLLAGAS